MDLAADTPFVVFGDDWGRYPSTLQHTLRHVATQFPVVWVNGIGHRVPRLNARDVRRAWEKLKAILGNPRHAHPVDPDLLGGGAPVSIIQPTVLPWHHVRLVHRLNTRSLLHAIKHRLGAEGLTRAPVLITGSPPSVGVVGHLGELVSVYYCMDDFLSFPTYTARMLAPLERRLLDRVDMVVATAASLTRTKRPRSGRVYHLPQGVNYQHFAKPRDEPPDLARIPRPRIGFAGSVSTQCDVGLIAQTARSFAHASMVLVGPVALDPAALELLHLPNVYLLGVSPYHHLPSYVQHFDVGIIPYVLSPWTVAVDPLKLLEYLAAGLPVVSTAIPEAAKYAAQVTVAATTEEFIAGVRHALAYDRDTARARGQALARANTWERRAQVLLELIEETVRGREAGFGSHSLSRNGTSP